MDYFIIGFRDVKKGKVCREIMSDSPSADFCQEKDSVLATSVSAKTILVV
jgi:hypothetical protein